MKSPNYYQKILKLFHDLKELYPQYTMGRHLSTIIDDYGDVWGASDKDLYNSLNKYSKNLTLDIPHKEEEIERILQEGMHLDTILEEEDY